MNTGTESVGTGNIIWHAFIYCSSISLHNRLNLASFVTTWMEPECEALMAESLNINYIDENEYPSTTCIQNQRVPQSPFHYSCTASSSADSHLHAVLHILIPAAQCHDFVKIFAHASYALIALALHMHPVPFQPQRFKTWSLLGYNHPQFARKICISD